MYDKLWCCAGDTVLFSCSGIAIKFMMNATRFLTSASLVRAFESYKDKNHNNLKVCAANDQLLILLVYIRYFLIILYFPLLYLLDWSAPWRKSRHWISEGIWFGPWDCYCPHRFLLSCSSRISLSLESIYALLRCSIIRAWHIRQINGHNWEAYSWLEWI